jgi:hypothetical protein
MSDPDEFVSDACRTLLVGLDDLVEAVAREIEQKERAYGGLDLVTADDLRRENRENLAAVLGQLSGESHTALPAPRATGRRRAMQGVPLAAVLRAYNIGSSVVWDRLVLLADGDTAASQTLLRTASRVWRMFDEYAQAVTSAYQDTVGEQARRDVRIRDAALDALLAGRLEGARLWDCATVLRLPLQATFVVVVAASSASPADEALPGMGTALAALGIGSAWRVQLDSQSGVVALTDAFTVERLCAEVAKRSCGAVGISASYTGLEHAHPALRQAQLACAAANPDVSQVLRYEAALVPALVAAAPDVAAALAAAALGPVMAKPAKERDELLDTMRCWYDHGGQISAVAATMYVHRNTVRFRLNRIAELTGRNLTTPVDATEMYLALEAHRMGVTAADHVTRPPSLTTTSNT